MIPYRQIIRMAAAKTTGVIGNTVAQLEASYLTTPLTTAVIGNTDFTLSMLADALVSTVGRIIRAYAFVPNHPFRAYNTSQTASIAYGALIPSTNSAGKPIVGVYGAITEIETGKVLTEMPIAFIDSIKTNTDNRLKGVYRHFKIDDDRLYHTVSGAVIDVVTFSASDELTAINTNGNAPLPDACLDLAWTGLVSTLFVDDDYLNQAQLCSQYFENCLAEMKAGSAAFLPAPVLVNSQQPAIS